MKPAVENILEKFDTSATRKLVKYGIVSIISVVVTVTVQLLCFGLLHFEGWTSAIIASSVAAVPSYLLNRGWVWAKTGRSHLMKEVVPFWVMAAVGLAFSAGASGLADNLSSHVDSHFWRSLIVTGSSVLAFAILWILKFVIFNKILFVHRESELDPALDGRTGLPT